MVNKQKNKHEILNIALLCFYLSFVMVLGLFIVYLDRDNKNPGNIILGIFGLFIGFCLLVGLQIFWHRKKFNRGYYLIHPPFQINIWIIFLWVVPAIFSVINPDFLLSRNLFFFVDFRYYVNGLYLVLIGCMVIWLSYTVSSRFIRPLSFIRQFSSKEIKLRYLLVVYLISMIFELFQISVSGIAFSADRLAFGRFISLYQWISYIIDLKYLVLVIVAFKVFQKQIPPYYLLLLVFVQVLSSFSSVFIKPFFSLSLLIIISYVIAKRSYKKVLYFAIITLFILVLVIPIIGNLRDQINLKRIDPKDITQVVSATLYAVKNTWFTSISFSWDIFLEKAFFRQSIVAYMPGVIMLTTPKTIPFMGFDRFFWIPTYLIPRIIWNDKPQLAQGDWFGTTYLNQPTDQSGSAAMTIFGESYMYSGWLGVVFASCILGLLLSLIVKNTLDNGLPSVFIALIPTIIDVENQFSGLFISLIHRTVLYVVVYWLMTYLSKTKPLYTPTVVTESFSDDKKVKLV